jgi:hypothetical protein
MTPVLPTETIRSCSTKLATGTAKPSWQKTPVPELYNASTSSWWQSCHSFGCLAKARENEPTSRRKRTLGIESIPEPAQICDSTHHIQNHAIAPTRRRNTSCLPPVLRFVRPQRLWHFPPLSRTLVEHGSIHPHYFSQPCSLKHGLLGVATPPVGPKFQGTFFESKLILYKSLIQQP